jgi:hypothetical protein
MLQTIMQVTGDLFEMTYYIIENFFFWHNKEKTLFTLNCLAGASVGAIPLMFLPFRYIMVIGLWGLVSLSSPFFSAVFKSILQVFLEYGIYIERITPAKWEEFMTKIEIYYLPSIYAIIRWIPFAWNYVPTH